MGDDGGGNGECEVHYNLRGCFIYIFLGDKMEKEFST